MTEPYSVELDQLDNIVSRLSGLAGFISDHLATLDREAGAVHSGPWAGAAAEAHRTAHREWTAAATEFTEGIADMGTAARAAHAQYSAAIGANTRMFRRK